MEDVASKMAELYCEFSFWIDLEIVTNHILEKK